MKDWEQIRSLALTWSGLIGAVAALAVALFLRRLLPEHRRHRGRITVIALAVTPLLHFAAHGLDTVGATAGAGILDVACMVLLGFGVTGIAGMLIFDISLGKTAVPSIVRDALQTTAVFFVVLGALHRAGVDPLPLITTSAVLTAVIGLAFQNIMANVLAGLALQIDRTFMIGDWIQVGARTGRILQIRWRSTSILTREGDTAVIPNAQLLANEVLNYSHPRGAHRAAFRVTFHHRHAPGDVKRAVVEALSAVPGLSADPEIECAPVDFAPQSVVYGVRYWIADIADDPRIEGEVRTRLWYAARRAGLEGPCPASQGEAAAADLADRAAALGEIDLFASFDPEERASLAARLREQRFAAGERILRAGEPGDSLYLVRSGAVRVEIAKDTGVQIADIGPGDVFGEMSLMTGEPRRASCSALSDVTCYTLDRAAFRSMVEKKPSIVEEISRTLARRRETLTDGHEARGGKDAADDARGRRLLERIQAYFRLD